MSPRLMLPCLLLLAMGCSSSTSESGSTPASPTPDPVATSSVRNELENPVASKSSTADEVPVEPGGWGNLKGRFVLDGDAPKMVKLSPTKDLQVCGKHELFRESLVVNAENKGIQNIVVYIYTKKSDPALPIHESYSSSATGEVMLDNEMCRFNNHITFLRTSQTLLVRNLDAVGHNTKIDAVANLSINPILAANSELRHQFKKAERAPVAVSCSIHPWMNGYVLVKDHPYVAVSNENGEFELKNLPTGNWTFEVWQEKAKRITDVTVGGAKTEWKRGRFQQAVAEGDTDLGEILVAAGLFQ